MLFGFLLSKFGVTGDGNNAAGDNDDVEDSDDEHDDD